MQGTHDRIRLLILQDLELIKLGLIDDPEITYCKNSYQNSKSITRQQTALPPDELNSLKRIEWLYYKQVKLISSQLMTLATFRFYLVRVWTHSNSVQLRGTISVPVCSDLANTTPSSSSAVDNKTPWSRLVPPPTPAMTLAFTISPGLKQLCISTFILSKSLTFSYCKVPTKTAFIGVSLTAKMSSLQSRSYTFVTLPYTI